jgi:hypothetical protein
MIHVANAMRKSGLAVEPQYKNQIWSVYYLFLRDAEEYKIENLLRVLPPDEHLATFQWLFENGSAFDESRKMYYVGLLYEACGRHPEALQTFESLSARLAGEYGMLPSLARAALKRLSKP